MIEGEMEGVVRLADRVDFKDEEEEPGSTDDFVEVSAAELSFEAIFWIISEPLRLVAIVIGC